MLGASAALQIEIASTTACNELDRLVVTGSATLAGNISASFVNGFAPPVGSMFQVLDYTSRSG